MDSELCFANMTFTVVPLCTNSTDTYVVLPEVRTIQPV